MNTINMMLKCSILLFAFLLLNSAASDDLERYSPETLGLIENAKEAIKKLADLITGAVKSAVDQLQKLMDGVIQYAEELIESTTNKIAELADDYLGKIKELKEAAEQAGVDISQCIGEQEEVIKNLPKQMALDLLSCVTDKINEGKLIVTKAIDEILKIPSIITGLLKSVDDCNGGIFCLGKVIADATGKMVSIPIAITARIAEATKFVATVKSDIVLCGTKQVVQAGKNCTDILIDITKCYNEIIHSSTTSLPGPSTTNVNRIM